MQSDITTKMQSDPDEHSNPGQEVLEWDPRDKKAVQGRSVFIIIIYLFLNERKQKAHRSLL